MDMTDILSRFGSKSDLARAAGVTKQAVSQWTNIPAERVLAIESATDYRVSRHDLRPDIYPRESWCRCPACERARVEKGEDAA